MVEPRGAAVAVALAALLLGGVVVKAQPYFIPNIEYVTYGYDIVRGSPIGASVGTPDPGITFQSVFDVTYNDGTLYDNVWKVPDGYSFAPSESCTYAQGTKQSASSGYGYQSIAASAGAMDVGDSSLLWRLVQALGTGSVEYQTVVNSEETTVVTTYVASCSSYVAQKLAFDSDAQLSSNFKGGVATLDPSNFETLAKFVAAFGTHYTSQINMGGLVTGWMVHSFSNYSSLRKTGVDVGNAAMLLFWKNLGLNIQADTQKYEDYVEASASALNSNVWALGKFPPAPADPNNTLDYSTWQQSITLPSNHSFPLAYKLVPIVDLLTPTFFPNDTEIGAKQAALITFLNNDYCGQVPGCQYNTDMSGFVAYFNGTGCPDGWVSYGPAAGRLILSANATGTGVYGPVAQPLGDREDRQHNHTFTNYFQLGNHKLIASGATGNHFADSGTNIFSGTTSGNASGLPFYQTAVCKFVGSSTTPMNVTLPASAIAFFDYQTVTTCPQGWTEYADGIGRFIIGSPVGGKGTTSNAPPLMPGEDVTHTHPYSAQASLDEADDHNNSGCCNTDAAGYPQTVSAQGSLDTASYGLPYVSLLTCQNSNNNPMTTPVAPPGMLFFSTYVLCPPGWTVILPADNVTGRLLVGLSEDMPQAAFGAPAPLFDGYSNSNNSHTHSLSFNFSPRATTISEDFAAPQVSLGGTQTVPGTGSAAVPNSGYVLPPYIALMMCQAVQA